MIAASSRAKRAEPDERLQRAGVAVEIAGDADVVENRERAEKPDVLKRAGDAELDDLVDAQAREVAAAERHVAVGRLVDAGDEIEDRGLARAVGPDEPAELILR